MQHQDYLTRLENDDAKVDEHIRLQDQFNYYCQRISVQSLPNIIGIGAGRSGTSSVYRMLQSHDRIRVSPVKEINFFGIRSKAWNINGITLNEYRKYFVHPGKFNFHAELSPAYMHLDRALREIKETLGNPYILVTLREPFSRYVSQFKYHQPQHGMRSFNQYTQKALATYRARDYSAYQLCWYEPAKNLCQSLYSHALGTVDSLFGTDRTITLFFDDLCADGTAVMQHLFASLGLPGVDRPVPMMNQSKPNEHFDLTLDPGLKRELLELFLEDLGALPQSGRVPEWIARLEAEKDRN